MDLVMDSCVCSNPLDDHARTIIHLDLDCFYVQVETLKNPKLRNQPVGIQQKHMVITSNYIARDYGVKKCMTVSDVLRLCPNIVLVNGEDLKDYRQTSARVTNLLQKFTPIVERLGLDENFVDVTSLVLERLEQYSSTNVQGHIYNANNIKESEPCLCGCHKRLTIGSQIALEMREMIFKELGLTTCAGVAYNKLLAKLVGPTHKPNQQTVLFAENVPQLLFNLPNVRSIPGIGMKTAEILSSLGIFTVNDIFSHSFDKISDALGSKEVATKILELCKGQDKSAVKPFEKPQSIGLEDSCKVNLEIEVENKFKQLLGRLMQLVIEDGRIPQTVKVVVRKYDDIRKSSHREQKQCNIPSSLFKMENVITLTEQSQNKLMAIIMKLFYKMVDVKKAFRLTLLGLAFTKFLDRINGKNSIASFFMKNVSVQSIIDFQNESNSCSSQLNSPVPMECVANSPHDNSWDINTDGSGSDAEPSPKKTKFEKCISQGHNFSSAMDISSPNKLKVAELRINPREKYQNSFENEGSSTLFECPPGIDESVFKELPPDIKQDVINDWTLARNSSVPTQNIKRNTKPDSILKYLISNN